jgi:hypothetical protein
MSKAIKEQIQNSAKSLIGKCDSVTFQELGIQIPHEWDSVPTESPNVAVFTAGDVQKDATITIFVQPLKGYIFCLFSICTYPVALYCKVFLRNSRNSSPLQKI